MPKISDLTAATTVGTADLVPIVQSGATKKATASMIMSYPSVAVAPSADDHAALTAAWASIKTTGGTIVLAPGEYELDDTWTLDVDAALPHNYCISGYGAILTATSAVTGHAILVSGGYNNFGVTIEGLAFDHMGNTDIKGCIEAKGTRHLRIVKCSMESYDTKNDYSAIHLTTSTPGDSTLNCFWTVIDQFTTRQRADEGTDAEYGIRINGEANATKIINCALTSVTKAISIETDGVGTGLVNGLRILQNDFEGVGTCIYIDTSSPAALMPTGVQIAFNRVESATTFIEIDSVSSPQAAITDHSYPLFVLGNYLTVGSVDNYLVNPANQLIYSLEPSYYGVDARTYIGGPADFHIIAASGGSPVTAHNLVVSGFSGTSGYDEAHIVLGSYHLWVNTGDGKLYLKNGAPTSAADGTVVGTQTA